MLAQIIFAVLISLITLMCADIWIKEAHELHQYWGRR
jgi:hypothetical protein